MALYNAFTWSHELKAFGPLHIIALVLLICAIVGGSLLGLKLKGKKADILLLVVGIVLLVGDIFKEIYLVCHTGTYKLTYIPWQICSTPMYILPFVILAKDKKIFGVKIKDVLLAYVAFFCFPAATFYFVKPTSMLYTEYVLISFQAMIHHLLMVFVGTFSVSSYSLLKFDKENKKDTIKSIALAYGIFVITACIAMVANFILHNVDPDSGINLYYISYYEKPSYPLFALIWKSTSPYPIYFITFLIYFGLGGLIFIGLDLLVKTIYLKIVNKKKCAE